MKAPLLIVALALVAAPACAPTPSASPDAGPRRQCFFANDVRTFTASPDGRSIILRTGRGEAFEARVVGCLGLDWTNQVGLVSRNGSSMVCSAMDADLVVPDFPRGNTTCSIADLRPLTDAEVAALDSRP